MTRKILHAILLASGGVLLASLLLIMGCLYSYFVGIQTSQLWVELELAAAGTEAAGLDYLSALGIDDTRLTWIAPDGSVRYDDQADQQTMENHADRQEVREAMSSGVGSSQRYSSTLLEKTVYCARRLSDGSVLRISISRATMVVLVLELLRPLCVVALVALALAWLLASRLSRRIVEPLNALDLDHPLEVQTYDELAPLLRRISQQNSQISRQVQQLRQRQEEFDQITASMNEGLVLLDSRGAVLSINPAAGKLFHAENWEAGQDLLTVERSREISEAIAAATREGHSELTLERDGRIYQLDMSRIESDGKRAGVVLLAFDVTERMEAERSRREFTANVSHELKTPLTAILGSSELLQAGMVEPEDMPRFASHIHREAARLLTLIEDILHLSQLDEGGQLPCERVDLAAAAAETVDQLQEKAAQAQVALRLQAESCPLSGPPGLFHEIIHNLLDNAIKYNVPGGSATVTVTAGGVLTVADTGIGIPPEHQSRVFQRFYRVDKSHSKAIGGTGLGLSIVKHACIRLGATVALASDSDRGTTITVTFPLPR